MRFLLFVLTLGLYAAAQAYTPSGNITANETWQSNSATDTLRITGDIVVSNNATLTIMPGTLIRGYAGTAANVRYICIQQTAVLRAVGTSTNPIQIYNTYFDLDRLTRDSLSLIEYCKFSKGWGHPFIDFRNPSEPAEQSSMTINRCEFEQGAYCQIYVTSGGNPTFNYCTFIHNKTTNTVGPSAIFIHGGGICSFNYCTFANFSAGIISASLGGPTNPFPWEPMTTNVNHCTFYNITGSSFNSGVRPANGHAICTVNYPGILNVYNSIFSKVDTSAIRDWTREDVGTFPGMAWTINEDYNCYWNLGGDPLRLMTMGAHSVENNPLLAAPTTYNYSITSSSPAWNTANDGTNMGSWQAGVGITDVPGVSDQDFPGIKVSSHVLRTTVDITFWQPLDAAVLVYNAAGAVVCDLGSPRQAEKLVWNGTNARGLQVPAGMYYVMAQTETGQAMEKIVKLQ